MFLSGFIRSFTPTTAVASPILPVYYPVLPEPVGHHQRHHHPAFLAQRGVPYVADMVYHPLAVFGSQPLLYSVLPRSPAEPPPSDTSPFQRLSAERGGKRPEAAEGRLPSSTRGGGDGGAEDSSGNSQVYDDSSIYSSFYSFLKTDKSDGSMKSSQENYGKVEEMIWEKSERQAGPVKKVAPWMEEVNMTSEVALKYQLEERDLPALLRKDLAALNTTAQPTAVNEQLNQMYVDLELEGLSRRLTLEEGGGGGGGGGGLTSSSGEDSSAEEGGGVFAASPPPHRTPAPGTPTQKSKKKRFMEWEKMVILFEENAPLPPPSLVTTMTS